MKRRTFSDSVLRALAMPSIPSTIDDRLIVELAEYALACRKALKPMLDYYGSDGIPARYPTREECKRARRLLAPAREVEAK